MKQNQDVVLSTINLAKEEIEDFKKSIIDKSKKLPNIKAIADDLKNIGIVVNAIKKLCDEEQIKMEKILSELTYVQIIELLDKTDVMFGVINDNLINGMNLKEVYIQEKLDKRVREIWADNEKIGKIEVNDNEGEVLFIEVSINQYVDKFELIKPNKVYPVITFINTKYNYQAEV